MKKRGKKCRKSAPQSVGNTPVVHKENSFSNIFCCKGEILNFRNQNSEPTTRSCTPSKKKRRKMKQEERKNQKNQMVSSESNNSSLSWLEDNSFFRFPAGEKISSVAFFIPFHELPRSYKADDSNHKIIDWNNLLFYECSNSAVLSHPSGNVNKIFFFKPTVFPDLKLKCRSISESSTNSEDSFISFESNDKVNDHDYPLHCNRCNSDRKTRFSRSLSSETETSQKPSRKKKVRFVDTPELVKVHLIVAWDYAYRAARISPWEALARDTIRFKQKIRSLEPILSPILSPEHRAKVYQRMQDDETRV